MANPMRAAALLVPLIALVACREAVGRAPAGAAGAASGAGAAPTDVAGPSPSPTSPVADASVESSVSGVLACLFAERQVAQYVHPEVAGRVPVHVHLPDGVRMARPPEAFGSPIVVTDREQALVDVTALRLDGARAVIGFTIETEGVFGELTCARAAQTEVWQSDQVAVAER